MQILAVIALIIRLTMLLRWLGPPKRRRPEEMRSGAQSPKADLLPPGAPIIS